MEETLRWGILGPGKIAHSFARDLQLVKGNELVAVASRNLEKAVAFGKEYDAKFAFGNYDELFQCDSVDVIYIATPHMAHASQSIQAMDHGKHVLCEKPMGVNSWEVEQMIACSKKNGVFLMEALWSRFNPSIRKVKSLIDSGIIGEMRYLHATFGFYALDKDPAGRLLNPYLAGGSILDIGIYPVFLAYLMLGKPERIFSTSKVLKNGVEVQSAMIFDYPVCQALLYSGLSSKTEMKAELAGTKGNLFLHPRWHECQAYSLEQEGQLHTYELPTIGKGYAHEIIEVHECLRNNKKESALWSHQNSLDLIGILDEIRKQNALVFPFEE
jgi:predicted dehydrogenase